jgi:hypothetical protein
MEGSMRRVSMTVALALMTLSLTSQTAGAQDACAKFAWPVEHERQQFAAATKPEWPSGTVRPDVPGEGFALRLEPASSAKLARAPERPARHGGAYAGMVSIGALKPGLYQITLSDEAWIDVIQGDAFARSAAHSSSRDCKGVRKSVRFHLRGAPIVIQLSDVAVPVINIALRLVTDEK